MPNLCDVGAVAGPGLGLAGSVVAPSVIHETDRSWERLPKTTDARLQGMARSLVRHINYHALRFIGPMAHVPSAGGHPCGGNKRGRIIPLLRFRPDGRSGDMRAYR